jgi:hypothetical protein
VLRAQHLARALGIDAQGSAKWPGNRYRGGIRRLLVHMGICAYLERSCVLRGDRAFVGMDAAK